MRPTLTLETTVYKHLLVPIDDTNLSIDLIGQAVALAHPLKARIDFVHVQVDPAGSLGGDAELLRLTAPEVYAYNYQGRARTLLAKAEAAARALGVPCGSCLVGAEQAAGAIVEAAHRLACDLIVMASHSHRNKLSRVFSSDTLAVLANAGLPVLITSTHEPALAARVIGVIRDEHRAMAAAIHAWLALLDARVHTAADRDEVVDLMRATLHYVQDFPVQVHHPKEEAQLFRHLRARTNQVDAELDELERQHGREAQLITGVAQLLDNYAAADVAHRADAAAALRAEVERYAAFVWEHMGREEGVVLPAAQRCLTDADWAEIDRVYAAGETLARQADTRLSLVLSRVSQRVETRG